MFSLLNIDVCLSYKCFHTALSDYLKELDARVLDTHSANEKKKHVPQRKSRAIGSVLDTTSIWLSKVEGGQRVAKIKGLKGSKVYLFL